jgi:DNA-binding NarL/FixJ family response regulator
MDRYDIVIADEPTLFRQGLRKIIEGAADLDIVGEAGDEAELLTFLNTTTPHLILLDPSMHGLRGIETIREIKADHSAVKVLVLTAHREYLREALSAGADGYLLKEDTDRDLFYAIEKIRQGKVYVSPRLKRGWGGPPEPLTSREKEVLRLIAEGKSNREIADAWSISVRTVEFHRAAILRRLKVKKTADIVRYAIQKGYLSMEPNLSPLSRE